MAEHVRAFAHGDWQIDLDASTWSSIRRKVAKIAECPTEPAVAARVASPLRHTAGTVAGPAWVQPGHPGVHRHPATPPDPAYWAGCQPPSRMRSMPTAFELYAVRHIMMREDAPARLDAPI